MDRKEKMSLIDKKDRHKYLPPKPIPIVSKEEAKKYENDEDYFCIDLKTYQGWHEGSPFFASAIQERNGKIKKIIITK
jgi:hypothetical protein